MTGALDIFGRLVREIGHYLATAPGSRLRQRAALRGLDERLLADIGITRAMAERCRLFRGGSEDTAAEPIASAHPDPNPRPSAAKGRLVVRDSTLADMPAIRTIYAHHVIHGLASFEEVAPATVEMIARRAAVRDAGLPYLAAEIDGRVAGYSYATAYRPRPAYRHTIEVSVYVAHDSRGQGVGKALLRALMARCAAGPWRQLVAVIGDSGNAGSIGLHRSLGFHHVGTLEAVGFKCGRWVDTVIMQCPLTTEGRTIRSAH